MAQLIDQTTDEIKDKNKNKNKSKKNKNNKKAPTFLVYHRICSSRTQFVEKIKHMHRDPKNFEKIT